MGTQARTPRALCMGSRMRTPRHAREPYEIRGLGGIFRRGQLTLPMSVVPKAVQRRRTAADQRAMSTILHSALRLRCLERSEPTEPEVTSVADANRPHHRNLERESQREPGVEGRLRSTLPATDEVPECERVSG